MEGGVCASDEPSWPGLESRWAAVASDAASVYTHTDLVALLCRAQSTVQAYHAAHADLVEQVQATHTITMPDLPAASTFYSAADGACTPAAGSVRGGAATCDPVPADWHDLYRNHIVKIQAPMVRCSRPAFRKLCRLWGTDVSYTHMILADSFTRSAAARHADFALYEGEDKLVVQLAAKSGPTAAVAARLLGPYCDAFDLNCGCPQRWAMREGLGSALLEKPEQVADMVRCVRNALPDLTRSDGTGHGGRGFPCAVKMRVHDDIRRSVDFARQCVAAGVSWLTVHGRTPQCAPSATVRWEAVRLIREVVAHDSSHAVPVVVNGGINSPTDALEAALGCEVGAVMVANGLLDNPAMFTSPPAAESAAYIASLNFAPTGQPPHIASRLAKRDAGEPSRFSCGDSADAPVASTTSPVAIPGLPTTPLEVVSDFVRAAIATDLMFPTTVQQVLRMSRMYLSPAERVHVAMLRSNVSVLSSLQELGIYVEAGRCPLHW